MYLTIKNFFFVDSTQDAQEKWSNKFPTCPNYL
jgi:hypothetical protein